MALEDERGRATFDVDALKVHLDGGPEVHRRRQWLRSLIEEDPVFRRDDTPWLSKEQRYERALEKIWRMEHLREAHALSTDDCRVLMDAVSESLPSFLHDEVFVPGIAGQGSPEQVRQWLRLAERKIVWGCYAQTELGHGSNVQALETTATFVQETDEIELHTPTLTASKWWPGGMAKTANFAMVMARLLVSGEDKGVHAFLVQIRDARTHEPMPGVTLGDIGPKFGYNATDNGFLRFTRVRVPRDHMLMGHATLARDGRYSPPANVKAAYGTMSWVRAAIVATASRSLAKAAVVGVRYSVVRRQFGSDPRAPHLERSVLDYPSQQYRVLPWVAAAAALHFTGLRMVGLYARHAARAARGDWSLLSEMHAVTSGLKSRCTFLAADGIECVRRACGGHGYSAFSGLGDLYASYVGVCAAEGENVLLTQQAARYLLRRASGAGGKGARASGSDPVVGAAYLDDAAALLTLRAPPACAEDAAAWRDTAVLEQALACRAGWLAASVGSALRAGLASGAAPAEAWRRQLHDVRRLSDAHCDLILLRALRAGAEEAPAAGGLRSALSLLASLLGAWLLEEAAGEVLESGFCGVDGAACLRACVRALLADVREQAVPLTDAFGLSDHYLASELGRADGKVYEALWKRAQEDPLNRSAVTPAYKRFIEPIVKREGDPVLPASAARQRAMPPHAKL